MLQFAVPPYVRPWPVRSIETEKREATSHPRDIRVEMVRKILMIDIEHCKQTFIWH